MLLAHRYVFHDIMLGAPAGSLRLYVRSGLIQIHPRPTMRPEPLHLALPKLGRHRPGQLEQGAADEQRSVEDGALKVMLPLRYRQFGFHLGRISTAGKEVQHGSSMAPARFYAVKRSSRAVLETRAKRHVAVTFSQWHTAPSPTAPAHLRSALAEALPVNVTMPAMSCWPPTQPAA